jgi:hypothetical protein
MGEKLRTNSSRKERRETKKREKQSDKAIKQTSCCESGDWGS